VRVATEEFFSVMYSCCCLTGLLLGLNILVLIHHWSRLYPCLYMFTTIIYIANIWPLPLSTYLRSLIGSSLRIPWHRRKLRACDFLRSRHPSWRFPAATSDCSCSRPEDHRSPPDMSPCLHARSRHTACDCWRDRPGSDCTSSSVLWARRLGEAPCLRPCLKQFST